LGIEEFWNSGILELRNLGIRELRNLIPEFAIPEFAISLSAIPEFQNSPIGFSLGSCRHASGGSEGAADSAGTDLARGLTKPQHRTFGVELHLLQRGFLITLLSALTHHSLQTRKTGIMEYWNNGILLKSKAF
jgi:hypothetical protein